MEAAQGSRCSSKQSRADMPMCSEMSPMAMGEPKTLLPSETNPGLELQLLSMGLTLIADTGPKDSLVLAPVLQTESGEGRIWTIGPRWVSGARGVANGQKWPPAPHCPFHTHKSPRSQTAPATAELERPHWSL